MEITILNRENGGPFLVDEGCVLTENKDETLDKLVVTVSNLSSPLEIEPYDTVLLSDEKNRFDDRYFDVDTFTETETCLSPKKYKYEITLFSKTKELEGIILPNLKITKMPGRVKTIWQYMSQYLSEYSPQIKVGTASSWYYTDQYILDGTFADVFSDECPEMQWNKPTLREVLNSLAMIKDHIVILKKNTVSFIDLTKTQKPNETATSAINYIRKTQSSEDYVSALHVELVNVTNDHSEKVNNFVTRAEWCSINSEDAIMQEDNYFLQTMYPIYKIKKLEMMFPAVIPFESSGTLKNYTRWVRVNLLDCTLGRADVLGDDNDYWEHQKMIVESKEWQVLKSHFQNWDVVSPGDYTKYKNFMLYYTRGSNKIQGFNEKNKVAFWTSYLMYYLKNALVVGRTPWSFIEETQGGFIQTWTTLVPTTGVNVDPYYMTFFRIEYETLEGCVFEATKGSYPNHKRVVVDNQTNSYVDSYSQGILEYMKANRLGNLQKMINATYRNNESNRNNQFNMLRIGDIIDDSIIYHCEYQIYENHIEVNAMATKDYVLRNYFTGVKAKIRSWRIADGSTALTRHDLLRNYLEFSYKRRHDHLLLSNFLPSYFLSPFVSSTTVAPLKYCFVRTEDSNGVWYPRLGGYGTANRYVLDLISRIVGNSFVFTFEFKDNYWVDKYIDVTESDISSGVDGANAENMKVNISGLSVPGGVPTDYYQYTDENGENTLGELSLSSEFIADNIEIYGNSSASDNVSKEFVAASYALPFNDVNQSGVDIKASRIWRIKKDSQEITAISTQFEFCTDTTNITFTREFLERQEAIRTIRNQHTFKIFVATSGKYDFRNITLPSEYILSDTVQITTYSPDDSSAFLSIEIPPQVTTLVLTNKSVFITDEDNNLLLAMNNIPSENIISSQTPFGTTQTIVVYLNVLRTRDHKVYNNQQDQLVVDTI